MENGQNNGSDWKEAARARVEANKRRYCAEEIEAGRAPWTKMWQATKLVLMMTALALATNNFTCTPAEQSWAKVAEGIATVAVDAAGAAKSIIDPAAAPLIAEVENAFGAIVKSLQSYQANASAGTLAAVSAAVETADANIASLEVAVKNQGSAETISALTNTFANALAEIVALMPTTSTGGMPALTGLNVMAGAPQLTAPAIVLKSHGSPKGWKAKDFKAEYNRIRKHDKRLRKLKTT